VRIIIHRVAKQKEKKVKRHAEKMCGIFGVVSDDIRFLQSQKCDNASNAIQHRGPDASQTVVLNVDNRLPAIRFDFHRLAINGDASDVNMQPFRLGPITVVCNGEIYNYKEIAENYNITLRGSSDCEIIAHLLYMDLSFRTVASLLDGVFAIAAFDARLNHFYTARDPLGVRSLFVGTTTETTGGARFAVASELKTLADAGLVHIAPHPPGKVLCYNIVDEKERWENFHVQFRPEMFPFVEDEPEMLARYIRDGLTAAVRKRMMVDRLPIGCFLSGGLDSSIVTSLVVRMVKEKGGSASDVHTFSIGQKSGSTDLQYAKDVADFLGTTHHECIVTSEQMLEQIPRTIVELETWDTTTVRAGTSHALLCSFVRDTTDVKVLFSGEGADELFLSYRYGQFAPSEEEFQKESLRLVRDLHRFDNLRVELACASRGLECRVPFLDRDFVNIVLRTPPRERGWKEGMEKVLLRKAFAGSYLPSHVLWRRKEAFSDGVSDTKDSWHSQIQRRAKEMFPEAPHTSATTTAESLWYQEVFSSAFPGCKGIIPYVWLPRFVKESVDPSARVLENYAEES